MQETISALMDGELDGDDAAAVIGQFKNEEELREQWVAYHLISDALGQSEVRPFDITRRVNARLAAEPASVALSAPLLRPAAKRRPAAYAAAASIAAAVVGGWIILQTTQDADPLKQNLADNKVAPATPIASVAPVTPVSAYPAIPAASSITASAPAQINDYLLAHRQFSPSTTMHGAPPYVRTAVESRENLRR